MLRTLLGLDRVKSSNSLALCLSASHVLHFMLQTLRALLCLPGVRTFRTEEHFNLFNSLAASLREGEEELQRSQNAEASKKQKQAVLDVAECRRDKETNRGVELVHVSKADAVM